MQVCKPALLLRCSGSAAPCTCHTGMGLTALLAFSLAASPATIPHKADSHAKKHYGTVHRRSPLMANLGVCTEQDCLQQGAPRTLAKLRKVAKGTGIKVICMEIEIHDDLSILSHCPCSRYAPVMKFWAVARNNYANGSVLATTLFLSVFVPGILGVRQGVFFFR